MFGAEGYEPVTVGSSKQAQLASQHLIAINRFLRTGDTKRLKRFRGKRIGGIELLTDPKRIREFAEADWSNWTASTAISAAMDDGSSQHEFGRLAVNVQAVHVTKKRRKEHEDEINS